MYSTVLKQFYIVKCFHHRAYYLIYGILSSDQRCADQGQVRLQTGIRRQTADLLKTRTYGCRRTRIVILHKYFVQLCILTPVSNFDCLLVVKCHCHFLVRLPTTKFRIWLFLAYCLLLLEQRAKRFSLTVFARLGSRPSVNCLLSFLHQTVYLL